MTEWFGFTTPHDLIKKLERDLSKLEQDTSGLLEFPFLQYLVHVVSVNNLIFSFFH